MERATALARLSAIIDQERAEAREWFRRMEPQTKVDATLFVIDLHMHPEKLAAITDPDILRNLANFMLLGFRTIQLDAYQEEP